MLSKYCELLANLRETREQVATLRKKMGIELGDIQVGYECTIENILELLGMTEEEIDQFWSLTEPES